ncbi:MAG: DNA replication/repair protein RecF [Gammaproteobacteria bacterium]|nr:DNA replication/repair protein RecF [Gammaproteobacteria bacterium]
MALKSVSIKDFRCLESVEFQPDPSNNIVLGENASGKTSLLEALFFSGRGRTFRSVAPDSLIRDGSPHFQLVATVQHKNRPVVLGLQVGRDSRVVRIGGEMAKSLGELSEYLPIQVIDPDVHKLVEDGPGGRRQFLDFGVFHVEHGFLDTWRRYQRALKQRNKALKTDPRAASAWDHELIQAGSALDRMRQEYVNALIPVAGRWVDFFLDGELELKYRSGWSADRTLAEALDSNRQRDRDFGATLVGPHRADLELRLHTRVAKGRVSRGQQKLLASALLLAQVELMETHAGPGVLLLDDPAAELDAGHLARLLSRIQGLGSQRFITGLQRADLAEIDTGAVFHVEQGNLRRVL